MEKFFLFLNICSYYLFFCLLHCTDTSVLNKIVNYVSKFIFISVLWQFLFHIIFFLFIFYWLKFLLAIFTSIFWKIWWSWIFAHISEWSASLKWIFYWNSFLNMYAWFSICQKYLNSAYLLVYKQKCIGISLWLCHCTMTRVSLSKGLCSGPEGQLAAEGMWKSCERCRQALEVYTETRKRQAAAFSPPLFI
jgi:hypothetical protein